MKKIEIHDLRFSYKDHAVLQGIDFSVEEGQLIALLGPNGVGKSTLFRCLLGLCRGYSGTIRVCGKDIRNTTARELASRVAYIPQSNFPTFNYTVLEMVLMGTTHMVKGLSSPQERELAFARDALQQVGIEGLAERGYAHLSGGEQQLVLIARALAQHTRILVMDEPTSNLDYGNQLRVMEKVKELSQSGYIILLSSHNPQQALLYADRILAMHNGKIVADGTPQETITPALLERLYGIRCSLSATAEGTFIVPCMKGGSGNVPME